MKYAVEFSKKAVKDLKQVSRPQIPRIIKACEALGGDPYPKGCKKLQGFDDLWRIRVGVYRVVYSPNDEVLIVDIRSIKHRKDIYGNL